MEQIVGGGGGETAERKIFVLFSSCCPNSRLVAQILLSLPNSLLSVISTVPPLHILDAFHTFCHLIASQKFSICFPSIVFVWLSTVDLRKERQDVI